MRTPTYEEFRTDFTELRTIGLRRGQVARIEDGRGLKLRVEAGSVWITEERSIEDVCLQAGEAYRIAKPGTTLISTLRTPFALVTIEPANEAL
jgi:Protein of unknown function (DUF2917)